MDKSTEMIRQDEQRRVLIVDDEKDLALSLMDILESRGYTVEIAHSAGSTRKKIHHFDTQVALLDIRLGRSNGIDLISALKTVRPDVMCVMMTAYADTDTAIAALHEGAYDYLRKPLEPQDLFANLERCFEKLRLEQEKAAAEEALRVRNQELQEMNDRLRAIVNSTRHLATCSSIKEIGKPLLEEFSQNMAAEGGSLYLIKQDGLILMHSLDPGHAPTTLTFPLRYGSIFERLIREKRPILIKNIEQTNNLLKPIINFY